MKLHSLVIGAASPLGATLLDHLVKTTEGGILAMDASSRVAILRDYIVRYGTERVDIAVGEASTGVDALRPELAQALRKDIFTIYNLSFDFNRRRASQALRRANESSIRFAISLARMAENLVSFINVSDIGIAGDYPGRFYESWLDVSQRFLDEVDATSLLAEKALMDTQLPVVRARIGLLSDPDPDLFKYPGWPSAARILVPTLPLLQHLPRMMSIRTIVEDGSLAPVSPLPWAARALATLGGQPAAIGKAVHLVLGEPIPMIDLLEELHQAVGGAKVKGGLPVKLLDAVAQMPGVSEALRRRFDQLSSLWTPHRYCLSRNDFDTAIAQTLLTKTLPEPRWEDARLLFFRFRG
jgi:hypothetical protein